MHKEQFDAACKKIIADSPTDPSRVLGRLKVAYESMYSTRYMPSIRERLADAVDHAQQLIIKRKPAFKHVSQSVGVNFSLPMLISSRPT